MRVLLVEDDPVYAEVLRSTLAFAGGGPWVVESVESFAAARERLARGGIDAVLLDLRLPDANGLDAVSRLCGEFPTVPVLVLTALDDESLGVAAVQTGAQDYLVKGQVEEQLLPRSIRYAIERKRNTDAVRQLDKAVSTMQLGVTVTDLQGHIVYVNAAEAEMHGYTVEEMLGQDARRLSPPEEWRPLTPGQLGQMRKWKRERVRIRKDGTTFPVEESTRAIAQALGCPRNEVFMASTGVIGQPLDWEKIAAVVPSLIKSAREDGWSAAAAAIMTTDTFPKLATRQAKIGERTVSINGFLKGSGMIAPDMATMLAFVFTDAKVPSGVLQKLVADAADKSLNCVTVDGDTSTSDTLLMVATGVARHAPIEEADDPVLVDFKRALDEVLIDLAQLLARDGEGASKFVTINVGGASSNGAARKIGLSVANSPLVKTAIAGEDANWGRIVMAVGKSGERADRDKLRISMGGVRITDGGQVLPTYDETPVVKHLKGTDIVIDIDLGIGRGRATVWTCDLTHGYIDINGSYRS